MRCINKSFKLILGGILCLSLLGGCGGGGGGGGGGGSSSGGTSSGDTTSGGSNSGEVLATATIGSEGGTVAASDGKVTLNIPTGALSSSTNITITSTDTQGAYELGPSGTTFAQPVTVTITYDHSGLPANVKEDELFLATIDDYQEMLTDIQIDTTHHTITGKTTHFSTAAIGKYESTGIKISDFDKTAASFRLPIGDSWDLSTTLTSCGYNEARPSDSADLGDNSGLFEISNWTNYNYPKISFNRQANSNQWYVATAFNQNRWLNNGWAEPSPAENDNLYGCSNIESSLYGCSDTYHPGEDWNRMDKNDYGMPIHAIADGIILFKQSQTSTTSFGNIVIVGHKMSDGKIIASVYAHMKDKSPCNIGDKVNKGDIVGLIGQTGTSGYHLHFEITKGVDQNSMGMDINNKNEWASYALLKIDKSTGEIKIPKSETNTKVTGWYWPKSDTNFISNNYNDPSTFIKTYSSSTNTDTSAPSAPTGLTATAASTTQINLSWTASTDNIGVAGYKIYRGGTYLKSVTTTSTSDTGLSPSTQYCSTVSAYDAAGNESAQSGSACATTQATVGLPTAIAFSSNRDGNYEIYVMNTDGTNQTRLTNNSANDSGTVWSPDGSKIVFESDRDGNYEIYVMNADGTNQTRLTNNSASDSQPVWSPNGAKIAFRTNRDGNDEIYVMNADGTNPVNLTNNFTPYGSGYYYNDFDGEPHWSPDGSKIVFSSWRSGDARVWVMNADGTNPTQLTSISWSGSPRWSTDGSKISYSAWGGLYVMNADGTGSVMIMYNSSGISPTVGSWSPDGTKLVLQSNHSGNYEIYTMNSDGSNLVRLTNNSAYDLAPYWTHVP